MRMAKIKQDTGCRLLSVIVPRAIAVMTEAPVIH